MKRALWVSLPGALIGALIGALFGASGAAAQEPDARNLRPIVMLLVDTSGSMERMPGGADAALPQCAGSVAGTNQRNRWTTQLEALTGSWNDTSFYCTTVARSGASYVGAPDYNYYLPFDQPPFAIAQNNDGVLDVYRDRVRFGLMTFDSIYTFTDSHPLLVEQTTFNSRLLANAAAVGGFSYGEQRPLRFEGCPTTFMVDSGARNASASSGALISVGPATGDDALVNQSIQTALVNVRPFGGTPTASLLHDLRTYFATHPDVNGSDPYAECRDRFALLLTDGQPDEDFRDARFNCDAVNGCPYDRSATIAGDLCRYSGASGGCTGDISGVFVVAFNVTDADALAELNEIADQGGTGSALIASSRVELVSRIGDALDAAAPGTTTRTRPTFVSGAGTFTGTPTQLEFNAGYQVGTTTRPWSGVLERTRYVCNASLEPVPEDPSDRVRFDEVLNARASARRLLTVLTSADQLGGNLIGTDAAAVPLGATAPEGVVTGLSLVPFNTTNVLPAHLGITGSSPTSREARRDHVVAWVNGTTSDRVNARLGDIYHSSPVAVGPPVLDIADESYNLFRQRPEVANRPTVVYVGTNDGILHAFAAEDWDDPNSSASYEEGDEIWGFIPPILLSKLELATASHQIMVDGTPVVRDIYYSRLPSDAPSGSIYHTVLIMGLREGGTGYFALDVTDPINPRFLWQYVGDEVSGSGRDDTPLGYTYARPAIGQVLVEVGGVLQERAIALLPGGSGVVDEDRARTTGPIGCPAQGIGTPPVNQGTTNARSHQRCWSRRGRILSWVDIVTGEVIGAFDENTFGAPLTGGVALYPGDTGEVAQRAFFTDADGIMWAVDFSRRRPSQWNVRPFHDLFWDGAATEGQPSYDPPIVSVDNEGNIIVLAATGDIDDLESTDLNRVVSLTERRTFDSSGNPSYAQELNWEIRLQPGEQVTGALELFASRAYFATFRSMSNPLDPCSLGESRIWGVDYLNDDGTAPSGYSDVTGRFPNAGFETFPGSGVFNRHFQGPYSDQIILGVGVTQRPTCVDGINESDPYIGNRYRVTGVGGGTFELTAQISGGGSRPGEGRVATVNVDLPAPQTFTSMAGFAGRVDY
jgi:type IV pilus assembly protein PilY1